MQLCTQKYITSRQRGVHLHPPYTLKSATELIDCIVSGICIILATSEVTVHHPSNSDDCVNPCLKYIRIKVYDLEVSIVEVTNCTMPLCITSWYSVGVYSPRTKIAILLLSITMYVCTYILCYNNCQVHWILSTLTCSWLWIGDLFSHCNVVVKHICSAHNVIQAQVESMVPQVSVVI